MLYTLAEKFNAAGKKIIVIFFSVYHILCSLHAWGLYPFFFTKVSEVTTAELQPLVPIFTTEFSFITRQLFKKSCTARDTVCDWRTKRLRMQHETLVTPSKFQWFDRAKIKAKPKKEGVGRGRVETNPSTPPFFFCSRLNFCTTKASKFARKPDRNSCYAG